MGTLHGIHGTKADCTKTLLRNLVYKLNKLSSELAIQIRKNLAQIPKCNFLKNPLIMVLLIRRFRLVFIIAVMVWLTFHFLSTTTAPHIWGESGPPLTPDQLSSGEKLIWNNGTICLPPLSHDESINTPKKSTIAIIVHSARHHFLNRHLIRSTWGQASSLSDWTVKAIVFIVGRGRPPKFKMSHPPGHSPLFTHDQEIQMEEELQKERDTHHDLIMGDFIDDYRNLSIKAMTGFKWLVDYCADVDIVVKTDDDVVVNMFELVQYLDSNQGSFQSSLHCFILDGQVPIRDRGQYSYVSEEEYPKPTLPPACAGMGYITNIGTIRRLREVAKTFDYITFIDDLFYMGIVVERNNEKSDVDDKILQVGMGQAKYFWGFMESDTEQVLRRWYSQPEEEKSGFINMVGGGGVKDIGKLIFLLIPQSPGFETNFMGVWNKIILNERATYK